LSLTPLTLGRIRNFIHSLLLVSRGYTAPQPSSRGGDQKKGEMTIKTLSSDYVRPVISQMLSGLFTCGASTSKTLNSLFMF